MKSKRNPFFKVIISGGEGFDDYAMFCRQCDHFLQNIAQDIQIITGGRKGAEAFAERYASERNYLLKTFKKDWKAKNRVAPRVRDLKMCLFADALISFWHDGEATTSNLIDTAKNVEISIRVV